MKSNIFAKNNFYWIYLAGFCIILALPLLNWPIYFSPPNWAKTLIFQVIFSTLLFIFLCQILWQRDGNIFKRVWPIAKNNAAFWVLFLLFAINLLATVFSLDFKYSFFGSPYRGGGFVSYGFYILFAAMAFLMIKGKDFKKLFDLSIIVGVLVSVLAWLSNFGLFSSFIITRTDNISSTIGGPNTLALYLMLLVFPALSFGIQAQQKIKKVLYLGSFLLFCLVILLTISQGAYLGLAVGIMYFFFLYPTRNLLPEKRKKITYIKIAFIALIILAVMATLFIKSSAYAINENYLFRQLTTWQIDNSRLSAWQVAIKAFLDRPILGYGPENFSIGFDRHYDPSLPLLAMAEGAPASWWDKAHNFALNLLVETGIIGFLAFSLLFGLIFWRLHKLAHGKPKEDEGQNYEHINPIVAHGMQTALVAYFANLMFNFENFSSYIIVFLIVGFTLHLTIPQDAQSADIRPNFLSKRRKIIAGTAFALLVLFLWFFTIKPFGANAKVNMAKYLAENRMCKQAIAIMEKELKRHSIIDGYARLQYIAMLKICVQAYPENDVAYAKHAITALQENVKIMPHYTRNWLWMVAFNNIVAVAETDPEKKKELIQRSREYLKTAEELSPNRHEALTERLSIYLFEEDYESSEQISQDCIKKYPHFNACYWYLGMSQIYLSGNNKELLGEGKKNVEKAHSMGYTQLSQYSLTQLAFMYIDKKDYKELEWVYKQLTQLYPYNPRYFAGLAIVHKRNGKIKESTEALKSILRIQSEDRPVEYGWTESQETITLLIENILELPKSSPSYHLTLHQLYLQMADEETDPNQSEIYKKKAEEEYNLSRQ